METGMLVFLIIMIGVGAVSFLLEVDRNGNSIIIEEGRKDPNVYKILECKKCGTKFLYKTGDELLPIFECCSRVYCPKCGTPNFNYFLSSEGINLTYEEYKELKSGNKGYKKEIEKKDEF